MMWQQSFSKSHQQGAVLAVSLLVLTGMTILGLAGLQSTGLQTRMAGNMGDQNRAFEAAEAALREGEQWVLDQAIPPVGISTCSVAESPCDVWAEDTAFVANAVDGGENLSWWQDNARPVADTTALTSVSVQPLYLVERLSSQFVGDDAGFDTAAKGQGFHYFRVTALGIGASQNSQVLLQSVLKTR